MAYGYTVAKTSYKIRDEQFYIVVVTETETADNTHEYQITGLPPVCRILSVRSVLTAGSTGTATSVDPQLGHAAGASDVYANGSAAATTSEAPTNAVAASVGGAATLTLFGKSMANGSTSGTGSPRIVTRIALKAGV